MGLRTVALLLLAVAALPASRYERRMTARAKSLRAQFGAGSEPALGRRLVAMKKEDQEVRARWFQARGKPEEGEAARVINETDRNLTGELKDVVARYGWPTYELVGYDGAEAAILILIHTPDPEFQRAILPHLQPLAETGHIPGQDVALVTDKLLIADGKPQRFGTQFSIVEGQLVMKPVEDPGHLEERRAAYNLMPMAEYRRSLEKMYKIKRVKNKP